MRPLPIDSILAEVVTELGRSPAIAISAAPGAGKTTRVPPALLDAAIAAGRQIVVLEPRRIAARAAAERVARERGNEVGGEIGYRVRLEQKGGAQTRLWFLTEGVFSRQIVNDPFLEDVGVVVLDEFHERHLQSDVALAVVRELQVTVRPDLKLVVMSATLETERIAAHLGGCPVVRCEGRTYPVEIDYRDDRDLRFLSMRVRKALAGLLRDHDDGGDVLVFLPGAAEIRRAQTEIADVIGERGIEVAVLHGELPLDAQRRVLERGSKRRVVLATNVAETALTVEGVTAVIDSGLARTARFDARRGINHLDVRAISRASADQRAGRAGRTAPGRCVRLWAAAEHAARLAHEVPEVLRLDLTSVLLELRSWGSHDARRLPWLDPPSEEGFARAERALVQLGAVDPATGKVTAIGQRLLSFSAPPRLARMLVEAEERGCARDAALLTALASERDIVADDPRWLERRGGAAPTGNSDLLRRAELFEEVERGGFNHGACQRAGLDVRRVHAVERARRQLLRALGRNAPSPANVAEDDMLRCVLRGFPDRVAHRRTAGSSRALMVGRTGVMLDEGSVVREAEYFVAVELERGGRARGAEARVRIASAIRKEWLYEMFPEAIRRSEELVFDNERGRVIGRRQECFYDLVVDEQTSAGVDRQRAGELLADIVGKQPSMIELNAAATELLARISFLHHRLPELELPPDESLLRDAITSLCAGRVSLAEVRKLDVVAAIGGLLAHHQSSALRTEAPSAYRLPSGREARIDYTGDGLPAVEARIQELFGLTATPRLARGRVPLVIRILGPNYRPVQITDDLESFWRTTYPEIRKQLRGRYPKHNWPEDPFTAQPTSKIGRRQPR